MAYRALDDANGPPPGWVARYGVVVAMEAVAGYAAHGQVVKGICRAKGCTRRVELDPKALCAVGLGLLTMKQVQTLWRCHRVDGCGLDFQKDRPSNPLILGQFVGKPTGVSGSAARAIGANSTASGVSKR